MKCAIGPAIKSAIKPAPASLRSGADAKARLQRVAALGVRAGLWQARERAFGCLGARMRADASVFACTREMCWGAQSVGLRDVQRF
eukprot:3118411-Pleurochrysis_carterae.AAC.1